MKKIMSITNSPKNRDPYVLKHNGKYYYCFSNGNSISMICANTIEEIESSESKIVFVPDKKEYSKDLWAPELHIIDNKCYIYLACDDGDNYTHRMYVLENNTQENRLGISVSKKVGNSVVRHRITRLIRESYRLQESYFQNGLDIVVVARTNAKERTYKEIESALLHLGKLHNIIDESVEN
jgi:ribonuclease P protein component